MSAKPFFNCPCSVHRHVSAKYQPNRTFHQCVRTSRKCGGRTAEEKKKATKKKKVGKGIPSADGMPQQEALGRCDYPLHVIRCTSLVIKTQGRAMVAHGDGD